MLDFESGIKLDKKVNLYKIKNWIGDEMVE